jgi:octaprenyl-diphosphate synthase
VSPRPEQLARALEQVEARIAQILGGSDPLVLRYVESIADQRGKRLRPRLVVVSAQLCGGADIGSIANCAACCELLHTATLIHDDVIDEAPTRRGRVTLSSRYGNEIAVIVGDYLLALVFQALADERDFALMHMLLATSQELGLGVIEEVLNRNNFALSYEKYYSVINLKTAALFSLTCRMGATLGGGDSALVALAGEYGTQLGMAFQVADDLLDLTRTEAETGKPVLSDLKEGRITLPVIHGLLEQPERIAQLVEDYQTTLSREAGAALRSALYSSGSIGYATQQAYSYLQRAREAGARLAGQGRDAQWGAELEQLEALVLASLPEAVGVSQ